MSEADWQAFSDELIRYHRRVRDVFERREQRRWSIVYLCGQLSELERLQALAAEWLPHPDRVLILDGSGFPKQGVHSAGVAHQY